MSTALVPASHETVCGTCGGRLTCGACLTNDLVAQAYRALSEVVRGVGGRGAMARAVAARMILDPEFAKRLTDDDLLAEVRRRRKALAGG